ncbi:putative glycosyl hydrolase [Aspergillus clavatus NRRL 1]|uniref:Glycosyl hydrolase, putative n=1 Tax=Aspergillus clavatus (strain ATCC 1007 / CBS 513.65 / DSM 816 / NCTC 3887 / NRRL 1 / QM 1276 / 107) TaxID=344612 RepID=A1CIU8_ASPCL|nr:glycosyl hydrolase, putative [Aspergillus clavatus NRRL 1]EAW10803.1 glycosyl hydrolase, putative [Aspergillus clavatus NRRL 1]
MKWTTLLFPVLAVAHTTTTTTTTRTISTSHVASHVIYSYPGVQPPSDLLDLISQGKVGGLILFGENVDDNLPATIQSLQDAYASSPAYLGTPLLIMTDQEGGEVVRLPGGPALSAKQVGASANPAKTASQTGAQAAAVLAKYHNNANLAPVLDVYREKGDFEDRYQRSYGNTSALVSECATAFITAQQKAGVIATGKHFPGLGAAGADENTDVLPVSIGLDLETLREVDEAPYKAAIAAGLEMVMASWAVYPAVDKKPAGLSTTWIQGELRGRLAFKGVTITDAIEAGGLTGYGNDAERGVLATQAGMDLILAAARNVTQGEAIVDALVQGLQSGNINGEAFDAATARILDLRKKYA